MLATVKLNCNFSRLLRVSNNSNTFTPSNFACCIKTAPVDCAAGLSNPLDSKKPITDVILSFDGQNLFDEKTSHFGSIFNLEKLIQTTEIDRNKNILVIALTSNNQRQIQYGLC